MFEKNSKRHPYFEKFSLVVLTSGMGHFFLLSAERLPALLNLLLVERLLAYVNTNEFRLRLVLPKTVAQIQLKRKEFHYLIAIRYIRKNFAHRNNLLCPSMISSIILSMSPSSAASSPEDLTTARFCASVSSRQALRSPEF
jgi:hypothetical protein